MTLLGQIEGRGHTCRTTSDHADLLAGGGQVLLILLPKLVVGMFRCIAFNVADRDRLVHLTSPALPLASVGTDTTQALREGNALMDDSGCLVIAALLDEPHIARHVGMGRAFRRAGNQCVALLGGIPVERIANGTGRTDLGTGTAEAAVGILEKFVVQCADIGFKVFLVVLQHAHLSEIFAGTHAAPAEDTAVHVVDNQRVTLVHLETFNAAGHACGRHTHILDKGLQLTLAVLRAGGTVLGMGSEQQLHGEIAKSADLFGLGADDHTLLRAELTGRMHPFLPFYLYNAEAAGAQLRQIGMVAEMGNIGAVLQRGLQDIHALLDLKRPAVDLNRYSHNRVSPILIFSGPPEALPLRPQAMLRPGKRADSVQ